MSRITLTLSTVPARAKSSCSSPSPVLYDRLPTYSFRLILTPSRISSRQQAGDEAEASQARLETPIRRHRAGQNPARIIARSYVRETSAARQTAATPWRDVASAFELSI